MISIIVGIIVAVIVSTHYYKEKKKDANFSQPKTRLKSTLLVLLVSLAAGLGFAIPTDLIAFSIFGCNAIEETQTTEIVASAEIVALQDNSSTSGEYFLGSGYYRTVQHYAFYYETENGYKYETLSAESTTNPVYINYIQTNSETPHIDRYAIVGRNILTSDINPIWFSIFAWSRYGEFEKGDIICEYESDKALFSSEPNYFDNFRYEIFIPEGSIKPGYKIDLE